MNRSRSWSTVSMGFATLCLLFASLTYADYASHPQSQSLVKRMVEQHGMDKLELEALLAQAVRKQNILDAISRPAEKRLTWEGYRKIFVTDTRIAKGKAFMQAHAQDLERAEKEIGVSRYIISAIIGVETLYGTRMGGHRVLDALATLAFDYPRRSKFFTKELEQYLLLTQEQGFDPLAIKGSYAGAMGFGQFIPSSYRHYAIDFDQDEVADLLGNVTDAIGSVANYFKVHKWTTEAPVAFRTEVTGETYQALLNDKLKLVHTLADLKSAGVEVEAGMDLAANAKLLNLEGENGTEFWVALDNFYVITRYNHSRLYAMAVFQLAQALQG